MVYTDYHIHSALSPDGNDEMDEIVKSAIKKGMTEIAFTEHMDYDHPVFESFITDLDEYFIKLKENQDKYSDCIKILRGVEVGYRKAIKGKIESMLEKYSFDVVLGSFHIIEDKDLVEGDYFKNKTQKEAYMKYFTEILEGVKDFKDFNLLGHLDFISRYDKYPQGKLDYYEDEEIRKIIDNIFIELINSNRGIEVNTSGIRYGLASTLPGAKILRRYKELGGKIISINSDAHKKEDVGYEFFSNLELLQYIGFEYITTFENREPIFVRIDSIIKKIS